MKTLLVSTSLRLSAHRSRWVFTAALALILGGMLCGAANAQSYRTYSAVSPALVLGSSTTSYSGINVNRNPGSPYYGYLYVCDKYAGVAGPPAVPATLKVKIFAPNVPGPSATSYTDTGLTITPSGAASLLPWDVEIGPDDTVWIMNLGGNTIQTAPPVPPSGTNVNAITQIDKVRDTPSSVTASQLGSFRGFAVKGPITAARVYIAETSNSAYQVFDVSTPDPLTAGTPTHAWSRVSAGGSGALNYGVAVDPDGNSYWTQTGGSSSCLSKCDPAGNQITTFFARSPAFAGTPTLSDATFVPDATAPGGVGYILISCRLVNGSVSVSNPHSVGVLRFAMDGTCLDGFGPVLTGSNATYSNVTLRARGAGSSSGSTTTAQYCGFDDAGNCYVGTDDALYNGQIVKVNYTTVPNPNPTVGPGDVVISQVYGAGGNSGASLLNDYIELFNRSNKTVDLSNWSVQYASSTGKSWANTVLNGTLAPGHYYLVQEASNAAVGAPIPTPDATGSIAMSGTAGKVALVAQPNVSGNLVPTTIGLIDYVGYGAATNTYEGTGPTADLTPTDAAFRLDGGCTDTNNNATDFVVTTAAPRNSSVTGLTTFYRDADGDTYGDPGVTTQALCLPPAGYVANAMDCNDTNASIRPGGIEVRDGVDNDCDGAVDEGFATKLVFSTQPGPGKAGQPLSVQPVVLAQDASGNLDLTFTDPVTVSIVSGTGAAGAVLGGTITVNAVGGTATFTDVSVDKVGSGYQLNAASGTLTPGVSAGFDIGTQTKGPWGDVDQDGFVTVLDAALVNTYFTTPASLTPQQRERIVRYGDIAGTQNVSVVGNGVVDMNDLLRVARIAAGILDPGTAGPQYPHYGDVDNDNSVTVADVVRILRNMNGLENDTALVARINTAGVGDVAPTTQKVTFGNGAIDAADELLIRQRAMGTEVNPPAYQDYWPLIAGDLYRFTDQNRRSGDALNQTRFLTTAGTSPQNYTFESRGYTVSEVVGDDGASLVGMFKGINGSIYALYAQFPYFSAMRMDFQSPMKVLDATQLTPGATWSGNIVTNSTSVGRRPLHYKVTVLRVGDTYTAGAGSFNTPPVPVYSTWSDTVSVRIDIGVLGVPESPMEMQQAVFFDFAPGIGVVRRGQAPIQGMAAPTNDRPLIELDQTTVRGITYSQTLPTP